MTRRQFYTAFARALARTRGLRLLTTGNLRIEAPDDGLFCPITFVAYVATGYQYDTSEYGRAAGTLGLPRAAADAIVRAADSLHDEPQTRHALLRRMDAYEEQQKD